jgi:hypothetical protein
VEKGDAVCKKQGTEIAHEIYGPVLAGDYHGGRRGAPLDLGTATWNGLVSKAAAGQGMYQIEGNETAESLDLSMALKLPDSMRKSVERGISRFSR